jgi:hypothetical protein
MTGFSRYLSRYFIFLMGCLAGSLLIFFIHEEHPTEPFMEVVKYGVPSWAALNVSERVFVDRLKVKQGNGGAS